MESFPRSLPKRSFFCNADYAFATSHKSVYDGIFSGASKSNVPSLAPRLEDYSEIFGGFNASRSSSIPLLHQPLIGDDSDSRFYVRSPGFDYADVFGDGEGFPLTASFRDLFGQCLGGYGSSSEQWSPAQSESLSDELYNLDGNDKKHGLSDVILHSMENTVQFDTPYVESRERNADTVLYAAADASTVSWSGEDKLHVIDDINSTEEFGEIAIKSNFTKKCISNPLSSSEKYQSSTSPLSKPFMTVSEITLRTKPSKLPPPSRPPPALVVKGKDSVERMLSAPILFGVKGDDTVFGDGSTYKNDNVRINHVSAEESIDRRDMPGKYPVHEVEQTDKTIRLSNCTDEKILCSRGKETKVSALVLEDETRSRKSTEIPGCLGPVCGNYIADKSAEAVAWTEAAEYFEVTEQKINRHAFNMVEDCDTSMQNMPQDNCRHHWSTDFEKINMKENSKKIIGSKEALRWNEGMDPPEMSEQYFDWDGKLQKAKQNTRLNNRKGFHEKVVLRKLANVYDINKKTGNFHEPGDSEDLEKMHTETVKQPQKDKANMSEVEAKLKTKMLPRRMDVGENFEDAQEVTQNTVTHTQNIAPGECQRRCEAIEGVESMESVRQTEDEEIENQYGGASEEDRENDLTETYEIEENDIILIKDNNCEESAKNSYRVPGHVEPKRQRSPEVGKDNKWLMEAGNQKVNELMHREEVKPAQNDKESHLVLELEVTYMDRGDVRQTECSGLRYKTVEDGTGNEEDSFEANKNLNVNVNVNRDAGGREKLSSLAEGIELSERNGNERELKRNPDSLAFTEGDHVKVFGDRCELDETIASKFAVKHGVNQMQESNKMAFSSEEHRHLKTKPGSVMFETKEHVGDPMAKEKLEEISIKNENLKDGNTHVTSSNTAYFHCLSKQMADSSTYNSRTLSGVLPDKRCLGLECSHEAVKMSTFEKIGGTHFINKTGDNKDAPCQVIGESLVDERKVEGAPSKVERAENELYSVKFATSQRDERKDENVKASHALKGHLCRGSVNKETEIRDDQARREEEEREREREKDRMAVNFVAREAHKRSYVEARERTGRVPMERATAEVRLTKLAGRHECFEKSSTEARLMTVQAFKEKDFADAEQQAAEKLSDPKARGNFAGIYGVDRFSAFSRSGDTKQSSLSSDLQLRSNLRSNVFQYSYSFAKDGTDGESPKRCKARLERYRRTAERAANALAEKNRRDLLAQKEREERNRVAEVLDGEVKRWSNGKEGNLRALLSTLQYILGPDSGWQPVLLTEIITSAAVKKYYKKAALCVHPDKLQQRGATIQQKYICEKVFDLLKEAWHKFNSEEW